MYRGPTRSGFTGWIIPTSWWWPTSFGDVCPLTFTEQPPSPPQTRSRRRTYTGHSPSLTDGTGDGPDATRTRHGTRKGRVWPICLVKKINKSIDRSKASVHGQETGIKARCLVRSSETEGGLRGWQPEAVATPPGGASARLRGLSRAGSMVVEQRRSTLTNWYQVPTFWTLCTLRCTLCALAFEGETITLES